MLVARHNGDLLAGRTAACARPCGAFPPSMAQPEKDTSPTGKWDAIGDSMIEVAKKSELDLRWERPLHGRSQL